MTRSAVALAASGVILVAGSAFPQDVSAQTFPYQVPEAPEFNSRGNYKKPSAKKRRASTSRSRSTPSRGYGYQSRQPYSPQPGPRAAVPRSPVQQAPAARARPYAPAPGRTSPAATAPGPVPGQIQPRPDCSQYPIMLSQARSQGEMRMVARQYLTCLMKNGWSLELARKHVISLIQTQTPYAR